MRPVNSFLSTCEAEIKKSGPGAEGGDGESQGREGAHLDVRDGRVEGAGPVDKAGTTVDDSFLMELDKGLRHGC